MYPAAALVGRTPPRQFASSTKESKIIYIVAAAPEVTQHMQLKPNDSSCAPSGKKM
jgi:hypothetical protein